ncbi:MAG TPA: hypothetical protein VMW79_10835 [Anaerolineae bacterium]|nr:hypothetical protein [Anaerolineae bacterium]
MTVSRRGFMGLLLACFAGLTRIGKTEAAFQRLADQVDHPTLPDTLLGRPLLYSSNYGEARESFWKETLMPFYRDTLGEAELEAARVARWKAWTSLDLACSRCGAPMVFSCVTRSDGHWFSKLVYKCPDCVWQFEVPIKTCEIPQED